MLVPVFSPIIDVDFVIFMDARNLHRFQLQTSDLSTRLVAGVFGIHMFAAPFFEMGKFFLYTQRHK